MFPADYFPKDYFPEPYFPVASALPPVTDTSGLDVADTQRSPVLVERAALPVIYGAVPASRSPMLFAARTTPVIHHRGRP